MSLSLFLGKIHFSGPKSMGWVGGWVSQVYEFILDNDVFKPSQSNLFIAYHLECGTAHSILAPLMLSYFKDNWKSQLFNWICQYQRKDSAMKAINILILVLNLVKSQDQTSVASKHFPMETEDRKGASFFF